MTAPSSGFGGASTKDFAKAVSGAKDALAVGSPESSWRVTAHTQEELETEASLQGAKLHVTEKGSTVAVTKDGDIVSVCKHPNDTVRGKELIQMAVENGGTKLDSYSGNHGFYQKCGFEAVSWCKWSDEYAPDDWLKANGVTKEQLPNIPDSELKVPRENIVFYKYTGKVPAEVESVESFMLRVNASEDYDTAMSERNKQV